MYFTIHFQPKDEDTALSDIARQIATILLRGAGLYDDTVAEIASRAEPHHFDRLQGVIIAESGRKSEGTGDDGISTTMSYRLSLHKGDMDQRRTINTANISAVKTFKA